MSLENLSVWTIPPNWAESVTETLEWMTGVLASPIGDEQRLAFRRTPRRSFEMTFTPSGPTRTLFDLFIERASGSDIYLPIWQDSNPLIASAGIGTSNLDLGTTSLGEFTYNPAVFIRGVDPFDYEIAEYAETDGTEIVIADPLARTWPSGTRVYPMQKCRVDVQPQASRKADRTYQVRVKFSSVNPNPSSLTTLMSVYQTRYVLETEPNDVEDLTYEYQRLLAELDNQTGKRARIDLNAYGHTVQQFTFFNRGRSAPFRAFLYAMVGRINPIWVPTFFADFDLVGTAGSGSFTFDVKRCGYTDFSGPFTGRRHILIHLRDGTRLYREILSSALVGDGSTERITLTEVVGPVLTPSTVYRISFLAICRLDQDSIEIVHHTDTHGVSTVTTLFRGLPQEEPSVPPRWHGFTLARPAGSVGQLVPLDVSADGKWAVGYAETVASEVYLACVWNLTNYSVAIVASPFDARFTDFFALYAVNGDGTIYAGEAHDPLTGDVATGYWLSGVFTALDDLSIPDSSGVFGLSADGTRAVGSSSNEPVYWDLSGVTPTALPFVNQGARASAVSDDLTVIYGYDASPNPPFFGDRLQACVWRNGLQTLLPRLTDGIDAKGIRGSADGTITVGIASNADNINQAVSWLGDFTITELPTLFGGEVGNASGVTVIGGMRRIVGTTSSGTVTRRAVVWDNEVITATLPAPNDNDYPSNVFADSDPSFANGIAAGDGLVVVGRGTYFGVQYGFVWKYY